ncbi:MAG TPA: YbhB/YbcL family Raf kinase inhibitor-like protein [Methanoregulaceae archaeon]|nr:YbhB/YbcL family Raf kinase inhibitor-like protein [Methanoregulaceae archaeon]
MEPLVVGLDFLEFPDVYTCFGEDKSPPIHLKGLRADSVAIWVTNPFIRSCCSFTPWVVWNLPPVGTVPGGIPPGPDVASPVSCRQGINGYGKIGYTGPCPPPGETHRYQFRVYGLDTVLDLGGGASREALVNAMRGHVVQFGETVALCSR